MTSFQERCFDRVLQKVSHLGCRLLYLVSLLAAINHYLAHRNFRSFLLSLFLFVHAQFHSGPHKYCFQTWWQHGTSSSSDPWPYVSCSVHTSATFISAPDIAICSFRALVDTTGQFLSRKHSLFQCIVTNPVVRKAPLCHFLITKIFDLRFP